VGFVRFSLRGKGGGIDKRVEIKYDVKAVEVPLPQAASNLVLSCLGSPGVPYTFLTAVGNAGDVRLIFARSFEGVKFMSGVFTRRYISSGFKLRNHPMTPACDEYVVRVGSMIARLAQSWGNPVMIVCQFPTGVLWRSFEPVPALASKYIKYAGDAGAYMPTKALTERLVVKYLQGGYPLTYADCGSGVDINSCSNELLLVATDQTVSTMIYAVNVAVTHPSARKALGLPTTSEIEVRAHE
jgi:hypothetical protein